MINLLKNQQNRNKKLAALIDGEHYPQINLDAINLLKKYFKGEFVGIIFLGGTEKLIDDDLEKFYGYKVEKIFDLDRDFLAALDNLKPDILYDLSDEPVVNHQIRMKIASFCFLRQCSYMGSDFYFEYEPKIITVSKPSLLIIGTGKRIGKTAVSTFVAKEISSSKKVCIVAMGRGGPKKPQIIKAEKVKITPEFLLSLARRGMHASSDYIEDALFAQIDTIGCRRCAGGFGGKFFLSNIREGVKLVQRLENDFIIVEGSGASIPPIKTDYKICVVSAAQSWESIVGYLGIYRIVQADIVFITMCEEPLADNESIDVLVKNILKIKSDAKIIKSIFRPEPLYSVKNKKVYLVLTASSLVQDKIKDYFEKTFNCKVVGVSFNLSDRKKLKEDLNKISNYNKLSKMNMIISKNNKSNSNIANSCEYNQNDKMFDSSQYCKYSNFIDSDYEMIVTELKAASVDVVTEFALSQKKGINYINNIPIIIEGKDHFDNFIKRIRSDA